MIALETHKLYDNQHSMATSLEVNLKICLDRPLYFFRTISSFQIVFWLKMNTSFHLDNLTFHLFQSLINFVQTELLKKSENLIRLLKWRRLWKLNWQVSNESCLAKQKIKTKTIKRQQFCASTKRIIQEKENYFYWIFIFKKVRKSK